MPDEKSKVVGSFTFGKTCAGVMLHDCEIESVEAYDITVIIIKPSLVLNLYKLLPVYPIISYGHLGHMPQSNRFWDLRRLT